MMDRGNMDANVLASAISDKDVDIDGFVQRLIFDEHIRDEVIQLMLTAPDIMTYYHCFYIVSKAIEDEPGLFFPYWHDIAALLEHKNSYHRDFGLTILANLIQVDRGDLFEGIFQDYFKHINDPKFMTGECCIRNCLRIIKNKPEYSDRIVALLLDVDHLCTYPIRQLELLKASVLEIFDEIHADTRYKVDVDAFVLSCVNSKSGKTRLKAREIVRKYGL